MENHAKVMILYFIKVFIFLFFFFQFCVHDFLSFSCVSFITYTSASTSYNLYIKNVYYVD